MRKNAVAKAQYWADEHDASHYLDQVLGRAALPVHIYSCLQDLLLVSQLPAQNDFLLLAFRA